MNLVVPLRGRPSGGLVVTSLALVAVLVVACTPPAQPGPTTAPAKSAATSAPARQPSQPAATPAPAKSAATTAPAKSAASPAAKATFDEQAVASFYKGKTIRIIVGSAPGGGYDTYARAISRHISRHIPGNPNVIVENMPGAGSLVAANHVYNAAEQDGTVIGHIQGGLFLQQLLGLEGVEFDALKWQILGLPTSDNNTCVASGQSGLKSLADAQNPNGKEFIVGGNAPGSATWDVSMRLKAALDLNLKMVEGYDGTSKVRLAMDQGEVDGMCGWGWESLKATGLDRVKSGEWVILTQVVDQPINEPEMKGVPLALDLARTEEAKQLIQLGIIIPSKILRPFLVSPNVPKDRALALRQAFAATMQDKEFVADAEKTKLELAPLSAEEADQHIKELFAMPQNIKERLKQINDRQV